MPHIANTCRSSVVVTSKDGKSLSIPSGGTADFDIDKDAPSNAAEIAAGNIVVGGTKAQAERVAAQGAGPATPQPEKPEKAA